MKRHLVILFTALMFTLPAGPAPAAEARRPNILHILADDLVRPAGEGACAVS